MGSQTTAIADLPDRRAPTGFGLLQRLCRFGFGLGDFWISARLDALFDDAEFGRGPTRRFIGVPSRAYPPRFPCDQLA